MILETERLILRPWRDEDAEALFEYAADPMVGPAAGWPAHKNLEESKEIIRSVFSTDETYAVCLKMDNRAIGCVGLKQGEHTDMTELEDECELGYWLGRPFWGQGIIPEAAQELLRHIFEDMGMNTVWAGYYEGNVKSRRVMDKLGFNYHHRSEGLEVELLNELRDGHVMFLTSEDWEKLK